MVIIHDKTETVKIKIYDPMKTILQNHDAVIESYLQPKVSAPTEEGAVVDHKQIVSGISFYRERFNAGGNPVFDRVYLSKEFITEAYNEIQKIESTIVQAPFDSLPF
jgi:hypothetical protein